MASLPDRISDDTLLKAGATVRHTTVDASGTLAPAGVVIDAAAFQSTVSALALGEDGALIDLSPPASPSMPAATGGGTAAPTMERADLPATHITIIPTFDSSITGDPSVAAVYENDVNLAIQAFESAITTPITVNIDFGWEETDGQPFSGSGSIARSISSVIGYGYNQVYAAVQALPNKSAVQATAYATLPASDPTLGYGTIDLNTAQAAALGVQGNAGVIDGWVGLNGVFNSYFWSQSAPQPDAYDALSALEHEISEVLGRRDRGGGTNDETYTLMDFYRYSAADGGLADSPGSPAGWLNQPFSPSYSPNSQTYFSYDGKTITLAYDTPQEVAAGWDVGDWNPSVTNDSFGQVAMGAVGTISATDWQELNVVGYGLAAACFAEGSAILTTTGPIPIERIAVGDLLPCASGRLARVAWIGRRGVEPGGHPRPHDVNPLRIRAGAFGTVPAHDLVLSPDHAVLVDGVLIPVRYLANGASIAQERRRRITYWHIELDRHDAVFAEGLACEAYLDTGNRSAFEGEVATQLHPDFAQHHAEAVWAASGCAAVVTDPAALPLRRAHTHLLAIAVAA